MPTFELSANGKTFEIDAPDQAAAAGAFQKMNGGAEAPSMAADVVKSGGIGLAKGAIGLGGIAGDVRNLISSGVDYLGDKAGIAPETVQKAKDVAVQSSKSSPLGLLYAAPSSSDIQSGVEKHTGEFYKPKTQAGKYAETVGEFLPAAALGPGRLGLKVATGVIGGLSSETAGQAAEGTKAEPYARVAGALLGGVAPSTLRRAAAAPAAATPTVAELKAASRAGYNSPEVAAVEINPQSTANLSTKIESDLAKRGFRSGREKDVFDEVRALTPPQGVTSVKVADIDSARKSLGIMAREKDAVGQPTPKAAAASIAKEHIDDYLPNIASRDVIAGDAVRASEIMRDAQQNWGAAKRGEAIDLQMTRADRQAAKSGAGSNIENSMRQKIATLLDNPRRTAGFTDAEKAAMESIVRGTPTRNAMRKAGKIGVDGGLSLAWNTAAAIGSGGTTIPLTVASTLARKIGERLTAKEGQALSEMVRSRSALGRGNVGSTAVQNALTHSGPRARASIPYAAIVSALMQPQRQGAH